MDIKEILKSWKNSLTEAEFVTIFSLEILEDRLKKALNEQQNKTERAK